ncbi:MAG: LysM peptidoglycan-binding domain-containing protein [Candidatus Krumholzibacteriia bacterium]
MMKRWALTGIALLALGIQLALLGCGGGKFRQVNVGAGEYYSEDEYEMLPDGRKGAYCADLERELGLAQQDFEEKTIAVQEAKDLTVSIRQRIIPIEAEVRRLEAEIRSLNDQIKQVKSLPTTWVIKDGESLTSIAMRDEIYNDIDKWERIFDANKDKIFDPYYIFPDTVLVIPRDFPTD